MTNVTNKTTSPFYDPYQTANAGSWKILSALDLSDDLHIETDVVIVGTGAGGGTAAEMLSQAGKRVVLIEEGPLKTTHSFRMQESDAYPALYQEAAARKTKDKGIIVLQGRCVGGSTTVNWTSSFRTPTTTLKHWERVHGLDLFSAEQMRPWFEQVEQRLGIAPWTTMPNKNNQVLQDAASLLKFESGVIQRNVKGCLNLGYCGMGCPTGAKQSMLVSTIPEALKSNATLIHSLRAQKLQWKKEQVLELQGLPVDTRGQVQKANTVTISAKTYIVSAGAIGSPALLMRSNTPDPHGLLGKRTFLHPSAASFAIMPEEVKPFYGAPQSIYSDHFLPATPASDPIGYKLEAAPLHPLIVSTVLQGHGPHHRQVMSQFSFLNGLGALLQDGFHPESQGGQVYLKKDGLPGLDYPISEYLWDGVRRALKSLAEIQFSQGAQKVIPLHQNAPIYHSWKEASAAIDHLPLKTVLAPLVSAHVMGGCAMGNSEDHSVVNQWGRHHQLSNLYVFDGSTFPTSLGANPQVSIYAMVARQTQQLLKMDHF